MNETKKLTCSICGKEHNDVVSRANCELACARRQAEEAKKAAEAKKREEQENDKAVVDRAREAFIKLRDSYIKKYGAYSYHTTMAEEQNTRLDDLIRCIFGGR